VTDRNLLFSGAAAEVGVVMRCTGCPRLPRSPTVDHSRNGCRRRRKDWAAEKQGQWSIVKYIDCWAENSIFIAELAFEKKGKQKLDNW